MRMIPDPSSQSEGGGYPDYFKTVTEADISFSCWLILNLHLQVRNYVHSVNEEAERFPDDTMRDNWERVIDLIEINSPLKPTFYDLR